MEDDPHPPARNCCPVCDDYFAGSTCEDGDGRFYGLASTVGALNLIVNSVNSRFMMHITPEEEKKFQAWLDQPVDWHLDGTPIKRRTTMHQQIQQEVEFGWHAKADKVREPLKLALEALKLHLQSFEAQHQLLLTLGNPDFVMMRDKAVAAIKALEEI